ncbi:MAG: cation transporter, partial [Flammeovirgaceae bacterium]|nr:cation transporter [Flammeovirgaceae bacterium]
MTSKISGDQFVKKSFPVLEMTCAACAVSVQSMLKATPGVKEASVNFANQTAWVEFDPHQAKNSDLQNAVRSIGYDLVIDTEDPQAIKEEAQRKQYIELKQRTIWSSILSVPVVI